MLVKNARFFYNGEKIYENVDVEIDAEGARIGGSKDDEVISGEKKIVMPSFFNAHAHIPMLPLRGMHEDEEFHKWLEGVWSVEAKYDKKYFYPSSLLSLAENIRNGVTDVITMYFHILETVKAAEKLGINTYTGPIFMKVEFMSESVEERIKQLEKIVKIGKNIFPTVFLHALYTADEESLEIVRGLVEKHNTHFQIHVSETREEVIQVKKEWGDYPVRILEKYGLLSEKTTLVHCGWLTRSELDIVRKYNSTLVHCPSSNLKLATHGFFPWKECMELGISVKLGTDSQASNNTQDLFFEMRVAGLIHKDRYWDASVAKAGELLKAARGTGWMVVDISSIRFFPRSRKNILANLIYNGSGELVTHVFLNGRQLYPFSESILKELENAKKKVKEFFTEVYT